MNMKGKNAQYIGLQHQRKNIALANKVVKLETLFEMPKTFHKMGVKYSTDCKVVKI